MKKLVLIMALFTATCTTAKAKDATILDSVYANNNKIGYIYCVEGYKYIYMLPPSAIDHFSQENMYGATQMFERVKGKDGIERSVPQTCSAEKQKR